VAKMAGFVNELFDESGRPIERYLPAIKDIQDGRKAVTTAGTAVALAASTRCFYVFITALSTNTNRVMIGGSTVVAAVGATSRGTPLSANEKIGFPIDDLSKVYVDSVTNGEGVMFTYLA